MQEHGRERAFSVTATKEADARREAQLEMCRKLGLSTGFHTYVRIESIKNTGRA